MKRRNAALFICLILSLAFQSAQAQTGWQWQYPLPQGNALYDVEYFSGGVAMAVGAASTVIVTTDGGSSWAVTPNAAGLSVTLRAVFMIDALTAVAVGDGGAIIRTIDGGVSWAARTSGTSANLYDVTFADGGTGYATGQAGTILKTADGGISWIPLSSGTEALLAGVSFVDSNVGTAVGSEGAILRTADGGASWTGQTSGTTRSLNAVQLVTENTGYAVGEEIVLKTTDGGATWNAVTTPDSWYATLLDLSFIDADNGFIVGIFDSYNGSERTAFLSTEDGGSSWSFDDEPVAMFGVSRLDLSSGLAVGMMGTIRRTSDGGATWPAIGGPPPADNPSYVGGVDFWDLNDGVVVASTNIGFPNASTVLRTDDGGETWSGIPVGTVNLVRLLDIAYADETTVYVVGHGYLDYDAGATIYRSSDGGGSWEFLWQSACWPFNPECVSSLNGVDFGDAGDGVAVGAGGWIVTIRSGVVTQVATGTLATLYGVAMPDAATVFAVGAAGTILRSVDGGDTWVPQASGVSANLNGAHFRDADNGVVVGNGGTILRTWNGGDDWYPQVSGTTHNLTGVSFCDAYVGFVVGESGTILSTTDGGASWTSELSPTDALADVHAVNQYSLTVVGGYWSILAKQDIAVAVFSVALAARPDRTFVQLEWSIEGDDQIQGFHIYRRGGSADEYARLNSSLIPKEDRTFADGTVQPETQYEFVLGVVFDDGSEVRSNVAAAELPAIGSELSQNYPNPFNPGTAIRFTVPETQHVMLIVYDVSGRSVTTLVDQIVSFGDHTVEWDGRNRAGHEVSSGVYYYQLVTGKRALTRKMLLIR